MCFYKHLITKQKQAHKLQITFAINAAIYKVRGWDTCWVVVKVIGGIYIIHNKTTK